MEIGNTDNSEKIISVLKAYSIPYWTEGKNVSEGAIGTTCPFCSDTSNHMGIFKDSMRYYCWRCGMKGNLYGLLHELVGITPSEYADRFPGHGRQTAHRIAALDQIKTILHSEKRELTDHIGLEIPASAQLINSDTKSRALNSFLKRRRYTLEDCFEHLCLLCSYGLFTHRMIIPVFHNSDVVGFQAVDLTGRSSLKYKTSKTSINDHLYELNGSASDRIVVVEGVFDCWRMGPEACASFGTHLTTRQRHLILDAKPEELILAWDGDAWFKARKEVVNFMPFIPKVKAVRLPKGDDPDSLGRENVAKLIDNTPWL